MNVKQLVEENNEKRKLLTEENEKYYSDLLVYLRLQLTLSDQQTEEILMELLDHLIEGQKEGKTAKEIFGDNPLTYTDEIIEHIPKETKRSIFLFIGGIIVNIASWVLVIRGLLFLVLSQFTEVNTEITLITQGILAITIGAFIILNTWYILNLVKKSLFNENNSTKKDMFKAGIVSALSMGVVLAMANFLPEIGPSFHLSWSVSLMIGIILLLLQFIVKRMRA